MFQERLSDIAILLMKNKIKQFIDFDDVIIVQFASTKWTKS